MAEGGYDPGETTNPFDPHGGDDDDKTPLLPHHQDEMEMKHRFPKFPDLSKPPLTKKTSTSQGGQHETSFIPDTPSEKVYVSEREQEIDEADRRIKENFSNPKIKGFTIGIDTFGQVYGKINRSNAKEWVIIGVNGDVTDLERSKFPKTIRNNLGKTHEETNYENYEKQLKEEQIQAERKKKHEEAMKAEAENAEELLDAKDRLNNLRRVRKEQLEAHFNAKTFEESKEIGERLSRTRESIEEVEKEVSSFDKERGRLERATIDAEKLVNEGERSVETARERVDERLLPLRDRIKEIFKKHGFTAVSVLTAIVVVIGVIVSNLKAGLTSVAKGVGNGLKELGKKLGQILPGMIGAIASFIFRTAGEVIGFLAKNAWLLVVGLVLLAVEQFKK